MFKFLSDRFVRDKGPAGDSPHEAAPAVSKYDIVEEEVGFPEIWTKCEPFTMTSRARGHALFSSIGYIVRNNIGGDIVECGVWRGGSSMIAMAALKHYGCTDRRIFMLDTFSGMTEPGEHDIDLDGQPASTLLRDEAGRADGVLCLATLDEVQTNVRLIGYPSDLVHYVVGDVRETAKSVAIGAIALLRLDTDFYDSTQVELNEFYPKLVSRGVMIVDDYGHWDGARRAVDEHMANLIDSGVHAPLLCRIDYTGRLAVKC